MKKKQEDWFLGAFLVPLTASILQTGTSSIVKGITVRGVKRSWRDYIDEIF